MISPHLLLVLATDLVSSADRCVRLIGEMDDHEAADRGNELTHGRKRLAKMQGLAEALRVLTEIQKEDWAYEVNKLANNSTKEGSHV